MCSHRQMLRIIEPCRTVALGDRDAGLTQPLRPIRQFGKRDILPGGILAQRQAAGVRVIEIAQPTGAYR